MIIPRRVVFQAPIFGGLSSHIRWTKIAQLLGGFKYLVQKCSPRKLGKWFPIWQPSLKLTVYPLHNWWLEYDSFSFGMVPFQELIVSFREHFICFNIVGKKIPRQTGRSSRTTDFARNVGSPIRASWVAIKSRKRFCESWNLEIEIRVHGQSLFWWEIASSFMVVFPLSC